MKKALVTVVALGLAAAVAYGQATEVKSVNVVGFAKKTLPAGGLILTTCNFDPIGGGTNTLLSVFGTNQLKQNDNPGACDRIMLWDTAQSKYQVWAQWTDGKFYKSNSVTEWELSIEGNPEIPAGLGMWVVSGGDTPKDIAFMGEVVSTATQKVTIVNGLQLVAYPFSSSIALQNTSFVASGATGASNPGAADRIMVWNGTKYEVYALYDVDGLWYKANNVAEWELSILAENTIGVGDAFWYVAQAGFSWDESSPYLGNL